MAGSRLFRRLLVLVFGVWGLDILLTAVLSQSLSDSRLTYTSMEKGADFGRTQFLDPSASKLAPQQ